MVNTCVFFGLVAMAAALHSADAAYCQPDECLVIDSYCRVLHREPDSEELQQYTSFLNDGNNVKEVLRDLVHSDEYAEILLPKTDRTEIIDVLYETILGREPFQEGSETYMARLEDSHDYREIADSLLDSLEYHERFGTSQIPVGGKGRLRNTSWQQQ